MGQVGLILLGLLLFGVICAVLVFSCSPMPVIRLLRRGEDGPISVPEGFEQIRNRVEVQNNLSYPSAYGKNQFDLYTPKNIDGKCPVILWVHGGAFVAGDKRGVENWGCMLAAEGYAVASMNYEWAPEAAYPAQLIQIRDCMTELLQEKFQKKLNLQQVILAGDSAGAHMAAQFATLHTNPDFANRMGITSPLSREALKGVLLYCGPYNLKLMLEPKKRLMKLFISRIGWSYFGKKRWKKDRSLETVSVSEFVTEQYPPVYLTDGNTMSFETHAKQLEQKLRQKQVPVKSRYFALEDGVVNHEYQMELAKPNGMICFQDTKEFLKKIIHQGV